MRKLQTYCLSTMLAVPILICGNTQAQVGPSLPSYTGTIPTGCTVETLNIDGVIAAGGRLEMDRVPAEGPLRVRATCVDENGQTVQGQTPWIAPNPNDITSIEELIFENPLVPGTLLVSPENALLFGAGDTRQLEVTGVLPDTSTVNLTSSADGTFYASANPAIASVDSDGLVSAVAPGPTLIFAVNDGTLGIASMNVMSSSFDGIEVSPASVVLQPHTLFPGRSVQLTVEAILGDGGRQDFTEAIQGTTYVPADNKIQVSNDGLVFGISEGLSSITVTNGPYSVNVPVEVLPTCNPAPISAFDTQGYAHNVELQGSIALVAADSQGLVIFDVIDGYQGEISFNALAYDVKAQGSLAAVGLDSGFALVDISNPTSPVLIRQANIGTVTDLHWSGNTLYMAQDDLLATYDVSDPNAPISLGTLGFGEPLQAVAGDEARGLQIALTSNFDVHVVNLSAEPPTVGTVSITGSLDQTGLDLLGTDLYVASGLGALAEVHHIDISSPANPVLVPNALPQIRYNARDIAVTNTQRGRIIVTADNLFVNSVPLHNQNLGVLTTVDFSSFPDVVRPDADCNGADIGPSFAVVACQWDGIQTLRWDCPVDTGDFAP